MVKKFFSILAIVFVLGFTVLPHYDHVFATTPDPAIPDEYFDENGKFNVPKGKRMDEAFGEIAFNLLALDTQNYTQEERNELEKTLGGKVMLYLDKRAVGFNSIIGNAFEGNFEAAWSDAVHWLLLPNEELADGLKVTVTDDLVGAISEAVLDMPDDIVVPDQFKHLLTSSYTTNSMALGRYFRIESDGYSFRSDQYSAIEFYVVVEDKNDLAGVELSKTPSLTMYRYDYEVLPDGSFGDPLSRNNSGTLLETAPNGVHFKLDFPDYAKNPTTVSEYYGLNFYIPVTHSSTIYDYSVYYKLHSIVPNSVPSEQLFSSYSEMNARDIYHDLKQHYGDNIEIHHDITADDPSGDFFDRYDVPPNKGGSGNIFSGLFDFIKDIPGLLLDFITNLVEALVGMVEMIIRLFIPTSEQFADLSSKFTDMTDSFKTKFSGVFDLTGFFTGIFDKPSELYGKTFVFPNVFGQDDIELELMPESFRQPMSTLRSLAGAGFVFYTFINIYKRIVGSGDVIK